MINGRRWRPPSSGAVNWNPDLGEWDVAVRSAEAAKAYFSANPTALSFALGVNDGLRFGESEATLRWIYPPRYFRGRPDYSDLVFNFMNRVAERVEADHPDKYLGALAYYWCEQTPSFRVHPQVLPFLTADRSQGYDPAFRRQEEALQRRWAEAGPERLGIYDYLYGHGFLVPRIHTALLARHLRYARRAGFTDYYAELYPNWGLDGPQPWLVAQLLQDPEQSRARLLDEYYRRFFRGAARPMRRFFEECEARWMGQPGPSYWLKHYRSSSQASLYPPAARRVLRRHLEDAARRAQGDSVVEARVRLTSEAFTVSERFAEFVEAHLELARLTLSAAGSAEPGTLDELRRVLAQERQARAAFVAELERVRREHPLALDVVKPQDFLRDDWGASAEWLMAGREAAPGRELLADPWWVQPKGPDLEIAGLVYAPGLPAGWQSRSEPWEGMRTELHAAPGRMDRVLRMENHKFTILHTVVAASDKKEEAILSVRIRASVGGDTRFFLRGAWVDRGGRVIGSGRSVNLPAGEWSRPVRMFLPLGEPPPSATHATLALCVMDQQASDWLELSQPSVRAFPVE